ncbi:MAG: hypothetical protein JST21_03120 [Bacteroidetes bacterium]|nr:hypothetical protein [Bacteroidota bacterium]
MKVVLENDACYLSVESFGGAIIDFHLKNNPGVNPLSFAFTNDQMPVNNKQGAPYRGHFLCAGRWGQPSDKEIKCGIPNHGEAANIDWQASEINNSILMQAVCKKEGLQIERKIELDQQSSIFVVTEKFMNINSLGRLWNVVQHPTLAAPFLDERVIINCNATIGFDQAHYNNAEEKSIFFPDVIDDKNNQFNLKKPQTKYNSVFSFLVNHQDEFGWITAFSPKYKLLLGYVWKRSDYPWIHLWQHWNEDTISYRGIEFGTAGIHQPFEEILNTATKLFGEKTLAYIDADECVSKSYISFLIDTGPDFSETENISVAGSTIQIKGLGEKIFNLVTTMNLPDGLPK